MNESAQIRIEAKVDRILAILEKPKRQNKKRFIEYSSDFDYIWSKYPKRANGNPKAKAYGAYLARQKEGKTPAAMLEGTQKYLDYCAATDKLGTEYVMQASTFFGPDLRFEDEYIIPEPEKKMPKSKHEWKKWGEALGVHPRNGETWDNYIERICVEAR